MRAFTMICTRRFRLHARTAVCSMLAFWFATPLLAADDGPRFNEYVDRKVFPKGYGILSSDHLMYPTNVRDWPVKIDSHRQLFIDDYLIASLQGLTRELHQPVKHPRNPLVRADRPWEDPHIALGFVLHDGAQGPFRMWYNSSKDRVLYAESPDGITWKKPELGLIEFSGSRQNNIVIEGGFLIGLIEGKHISPPQEGYRAVVCQNPPFVPESGYYVYRSPDGLRWAREFGHPIFTSTTNPELYNTVGAGDTSILRYDPVLGRYVCDAKTNIYMPPEAMKQLGIVPDFKNRIRSRAMMESEDLIHWTSPRMTLFPDDLDQPDAQIYGHIGFVYESMWVGMARIMHIQHAGWKQTEIELTHSRDGRHWSRPDVRRPFIPLGEASGWEPDYSDPAHNGPLLIDDELWFFYRGSRNAERDKAKYYTMCFGLAKLRRDGFVSLNAGGKPGQVVTRPLTTAGRSLFVNADVQAGGWVKVAVLSAKSQPLASYTLDESSPLTANTTHGHLTWRGAERIEFPKDGHVRLMFQLKNAKLYSFWLE
jgi:hypothetical protein